MSIDREKLAQACMVLRLDVFEANEYDFLFEYQRVMRAIARALKTMEANKYTFGVFLPTLFALRYKLAAFQKTVIHCEPLVKVLQNGLEERFGNVMDIFDPDGKSVPPFVAMVSNPTYKLNYIGLETIPSHMLMRVKQMLFDAVMDVTKIETNSEEQSSDLTSQAKGNWLNKFAFYLH